MPLKSAGKLSSCSRCSGCKRVSISRFILVRHGETAGNKDGLFYGSTDLPLTEHGHRQASAVAAYLRDIQIDTILISELQRARQTAEYIRAPETHHYHCDPRLNEMHFGEWEMQHYSEIAARYPADWETWMKDWLHAAPTGGEPFPQFAARVQAVADELRREASETPATRLIVAHKGVLGLIITRWFGLPAEAMWQFPCEQDSYSVAECRDGFMTLAVFNGRSRFTPVV